MSVSKDKKGIPRFEYEGRKSCNHRIYNNIRVIDIVRKHKFRSRTISNRIESGSVYFFAHNQSYFLRVALNTITQTPIHVRVDNEWSLDVIVSI